MKRGIIFLLILFSAVALISALPTFPPTTCSEIWGGDCGEGPPETFDNTFDNCGYGIGNSESIQEIYLNKNSLFVGEPINVICNVLLKDRMREILITSEATGVAICRCDLSSHLTNPHCQGGNFYIYYKSPGNNWVQKYSQSPVITCENYSVSFLPDQIEGEHQVRCVLGYDLPETSCPSGTHYDVDDANFTVYSEFISITITNSPIDFGEVDMNTTKNATNNPLIIAVDSNVIFDITTSASDFSDGEDTFSVSNMFWATSENIARTPYSLIESVIYSNQEPGSFNLYHSLFIPLGQRAGTYNSEVVITAKKSE